MILGHLHKIEREFLMAPIWIRLVYFGVSALPPARSLRPTVTRVTPTRPKGIRLDTALSRLNQRLLASLHHPTCFPYSSTALVAQFGTDRLYTTCFSQEDDSQSYSYRGNGGELVVVGRQMHVTIQRLFVLADSLEISLDDVFGSGRTCTLDPRWEGKTFRRYRQWEVAGYTVQSRVNILNAPEVASTFPYVAVEIVQGHVDCGRWIGPPRFG